MEVAESSVSGSTGSRQTDTLGLGWAFETSEPTPIDILSPAKPIVPPHEPMGPFSFKPPLRGDVQGVGGGGYLLF